MNKLNFTTSSISEEFSGTELGDVRLDHRLVKVVERIAASPTASFPDAMVTVSELEGAYRLLNNEHCSTEVILAPHVDRTWERARSADYVLSVEDTTEMRYGGMSARKGLGPLMNGGQGFYLHYGLLVGLPAAPVNGAYWGVPLGVAAHEIMVRAAEQPKKPWREAFADPNKESLRWNRVAKSIDDEAKARGVSVIHVADREASITELMAEIIGRGGRFIIRARSDFLSRTKTVGSIVTTCSRKVLLSAKTQRGKGRAAKNPRKTRTATLRISADRISIPAPHHLPNIKLPELTRVIVEELDTPEGCEPIKWTLLTTESVNSMADLERITDMYRARWLIEEFNKALKTGCSAEDRQLESLAALTNALALFIPIAWHMLLLRTVVRDAPDTSARKLVTPRQWIILIVLGQDPNNEFGIRLGPSPTARELLFAIARMGGHLPANGTPGWLTLRRGLNRLYEFERVSSILGFLPRCDQS